MEHRIIREAGEAEASRPGPDRGADRPVQRKYSPPLWAPKFLEREKLRFS